MIAIGGKTKTQRPIKPEIVIRRIGLNEYAKFNFSDMTIEWVGDPNAASKFDSKYNAKARVRDMELPAWKCKVI